MGDGGTDKEQQHMDATGGRAVLRKKRRLSVGAYLVVVFAGCIATVAALVGFAAVNSFSRERARTSSDLRSAAQSTSNDLSLALGPGLDTTLSGLATTPGLSTFDPAQCNATFDSLRSGIEGARIHLFDPDGRLVCSLEDPAIGTVVPSVGPWFADAVASGAAVRTEPTIDQLTGRPAFSDAVPVTGTDGRAGVLLIVVYPGTPPITRPVGIPTDTQILVLNADRTLVLGTTPDSLDPAGTVDGTVGFSKVAAGGSTSLTDRDGATWLYTQTDVADLGWHVLAGRKESVALSPARSQLTRMILIGLAALVVLLLLGTAVRRKLAHPLRKLEDVASRGAAGEDDVRAEASGPREIASVAERLNALLTERQAREADLRWRATHDVLTGLPNRAAIAETLTELLDGSDEQHAVLFVDLDRFKLVNDSHGHPTGDQLLVQLGDRVRTALAGTGTVGRFGGDEFVVVCPNTDALAAQPVATQLIDIIREPFEVDGNRLYVSACVGIATSRRGELADDLIAQADAAMYRAKSFGTAHVAHFDDSLREKTRERLALESDLHSALERDELVVHYQPIVDVHRGEIVSAEALLRWQHPERGLLGPDQFLDIAEETNLIVAIGDWVLAKATAQAVAWSAKFGRSFPVAVNVAASQFSSGDLADRVATTLRDANAAPGLIDLEVTESALLEDPEFAAAILGRLRHLGVRVSLDDFGTGYSSLSYLQQLPLDTIKIDRSFVSRLELDSTSNRIVRSVVDLADALSLVVIGEGVENERQLDNLKRIGCRYAQGYLFARPGPAEQLERLVAAGPIAAVVAASVPVSSLSA